MENEKLDLYKALAGIAHISTKIDSEKHPKLITFEHNHYFVVCNEDMFEEYEDFVATNSETLKEIFPNQFKCFKLEEMLAAKLTLIAMHCKENYDISCGTRFAVIEDKLYAIKMLSCYKPKEGSGFVLMKCDLIEDDRSLGSFMFINKSANYLLNKLGGVCVDVIHDPNLLETYGYGKAGVVSFMIKIFGMFEPESSNAYESKIDNTPNRLYVESDNYKMVQFDSIESVKNWIGTDGSGKCPYINTCAIRLESKHLRIRKWMAKLYTPNFSFVYRSIKKATVGKF